MRFPSRLLICILLLSWLLTGCSTPATRAHRQPAVMRGLSPAERGLVLRGKLYPGMSQGAVYIAWGDPDIKSTAGDGGKSAAQVWVYRQRITLYEPMDAYYAYGPFHGFYGDRIGGSLMPPYAYHGGIATEGTLRYQPHVRSLDAVRIVEFSGGKLDRYKDVAGGWHKTEHPRTLTAAPTARKFPPHVRTRHHVSHSRSHSSWHTRHSRPS